MVLQTVNLSYKKKKHNRAIMGWFFFAQIYNYRVKKKISEFFHWNIRFGNKKLSRVDKMKVFVAKNDTKLRSTDLDVHVLLTLYFFRIPAIEIAFKVKWKEKQSYPFSRERRGIKPHPLDSIYQEILQPVSLYSNLQKNIFWLKG